MDQVSQFTEKTSANEEEKINYSDLLNPLYEKIFKHTKILNKNFINSNSN
mgnify:CR=1 FL=1